MLLFLSEIHWYLYFSKSMRKCQLYVIYIITNGVHSHTIFSFFFGGIFAWKSKCSQNSLSVIILCWFGRLGRAGSCLQYLVNSSQSISSISWARNFLKTSLFIFLLRSFPKKKFINPEYCVFNNSSGVPQSSYLPNPPLEK